MTSERDVTIEKTALALLALKSSRSRKFDDVIARIEGREFEYFMRGKRLVIGRSSPSRGLVDVDIKDSVLVSRFHLAVHYESPHFYLQCLGRNGIFVDGVYQRPGADAQLLLNMSVLRFPSTNIRLLFQSFVHENHEKNENHRSSHPMADPASDPSNNPVSDPIHDAVSDPSNDPNKEMTEPVADPVHVPISDPIHDKISDPSNDPGAKPAFSYAQLIVQAISTAVEEQLTLSDIYAHIIDKYAYYRRAGKGWQNSIRHNLSLNRYFVKVPRAHQQPGKGSFWRIDPACKARLMEQAFQQRQPRNASMKTSN